MYGIVSFFQMGGFFMFPILLTLAIGIAIGIERWPEDNIGAKSGECNQIPLEFQVFLTIMN